MRYLFFFIFSFISSFAFAQVSVPDTFKVADATKKLKPFERKYIQYIEDKNGFVKFNALLTRKLERVKKDGKDSWLMVQAYQLEKSIDKDSSYSEAVSLKPMAYFTDIPSEAHQEKVIFSDDFISNKVIYKDSVTNVNKPNNKLYNGVIADDIISCMPLKLNASFAFKAVNPGARYTEFLTVVTVEGQEEVEVPGLGKVLCWRLRTGKGGRGGSVEWYTVKEQIQVKKKFEFGNGSAWYRVLLVG